jgi:hypothetical protein
MTPLWGGWSDTDGTFGSFAGAPTENSGGNSWQSLWIAGYGAHGSLDLTISNGTATDYVMDHFRFDMWNAYGDSPRYWTLSTTDIVGWSDISGDPNTWFGVDPSYGGANDYTDVDIDLSGGATEAARTLAAGDSVTFTLEIIDWEGSSGIYETTRTYLDNIAITTIPEPATLGLLGMASIVLLAGRRLRR